MDLFTLKKMKQYYSKDLKKIIKVPLSNDVHQEGLLFLDSENHLQIYPFEFSSVKL